MIRVLECNRCGSVTGYDTVEELVTRVQAHHLRRTGPVSTAKRFS